MKVLKNYTSTVPSFRTIAEIEQLLAEMGAQGVTKQFGAPDSGEPRVTAIVFHVPSPTGGDPLSVRLPANPAAVYEVLKKECPRTALAALKQQSDRTAWRLQLDWLKVQVSLIRCNQVEAMQVFLPYVWDGKTTLYDSLKCRGFKLLGNA